MAQKWNLQDIRPAGSSRSAGRKPAAPRGPQQDITAKRPAREERTYREDPDLASIDVIDGRSKRKKRIFTSVLVAVVILGAGFFLNTLLSGAELTVYPKYKDTAVQATFTAFTEPSAGDLGYELLVLEANGERQVSATGQEEVAQRATGNVFIYNAYSDSTQRLIKNTRFESPEGFIYRIEESVEVPGRTRGESGEIVPGVVSANVFADGTGEQYNIEPARFTIPGLEGTEQYEGMYAESTEYMSGGFEGLKFIIDEGELHTAKQALQLELRDALLSRLEDEAPAGFIVFPDAVNFTFESLPATEYGDELATIKELGKLQVPLFKETEFAEYLAENTVAGYEGEQVLVKDPYGLTFSHERKSSTTDDLSDQSEIEFTLSGNARIIWQFDAEKLSADLVGRSKTALPAVLSGYPAIDRAEAVVRPFWSQSFPEAATEMKVLTVLGERPQ